MFVDLLSGSANVLYERLLASSGCPPQELADAGPALDELRDLGLVWQEEAASSEASVVKAVSPAAALGRLLLRRQTELAELYQDLLAQYARWEEMMRDDPCFAQRTMTVEGLDLLTGPAVAAAERNLVAAARHECLELAPDAPAAAVDNGGAKGSSGAAGVPLSAGAGDAVRRRVVCTPARLDAARAAGCLDGARREWFRVLPSLPLRLLVCDGTALLRHGPDGGQAVVFRAPCVVAGLREYAELLWARATRVRPDEPVPAGLTPTSARVLRLLAAGFTDQAVAASLGISTRSVRRHVETLEQQAGAANRLTLGIAAVRNGWLRRT